MTRETISAAPPVPVLITARQLHELLGQFITEEPEIGDCSVLIASDPEGNRYRGVSNKPEQLFSLTRITATSWRGVAVDDEPASGTENALVIWPSI